MEILMDKEKLGMQGYLNYFENECNFIADTAYTITSGSSVFICSGEYDGREAVYKKEKGISFLMIGEQKIKKLQGIMLKVQVKDLEKK
ncbi:MAG: hypothetical protein PHW34_05975 [Hespellia sp.]|nr:hypothetical protein [Hespellia sp.]